MLEALITQKAGQMSYLVKNPSVISVTSLSVTLEWAKNHDMERRVPCCETAGNYLPKRCKAV